jgi:hypothetical protein
MVDTVRLLLGFQALFGPASLVWTRLPFWSLSDFKTEVDLGWSCILSLVERYASDLLVQPILLSTTRLWVQMSVHYVSESRMM